jgi:hypothetical protein
MRLLLVAALAIVSFTATMTYRPTDANAVVCARGVFRAACVGRFGGVVVRRPFFGARRAFVYGYRRPFVYGYRRPFAYGYRRAFVFGYRRPFVYGYRRAFVFGYRRPFIRRF